MMKLYYDLHIHSCLSPCGDMDMTPNNIVNMALLQELDVIAVTDHNTALQLPAVFEVASATDLLIIPGIEVCTSEEVHIVCLFEQLKDCLAFGDYLYQVLPPIQNQTEIFGEQVIMNDQDEPIGSVDKLLITAVDLDIDHLLAVLPSYHGHAIPAHVDKNAYSIISNLGFIPPDYDFTAVEVKKPPFDYGIEAITITNSDAHYLQDIAPAVRQIEVCEKSCTAVLTALGFKP